MKKKKNWQRAFIISFLEYTHNQWVSSNQLKEKKEKKKREKEICWRDIFFFSFLSWLVTPYVFHILCVCVLHKAPTFRWLARFPLVSFFSCTRLLQTTPPRYFFTTGLQTFSVVFFFSNPFLVCAIPFSSDILHHSVHRFIFWGAK